MTVLSEPDSPVPGRHRLQPMPKPQGASRELVDAIDHGKEMLEGLLRQLGTGAVAAPTHPPGSDLQEAVATGAMRSFGSTMIEKYREAVSVVDRTRDSIRDSDRNVGAAAALAAIATESAYSDIKGYAEELRETLANAPPPIRATPTERNPDPPWHLAPDVEVKLLAAVARSVSRATDRMVALDSTLQQIAQSIRSSAPAEPGAEAGRPAEGPQSTASSQGGSPATSAALPSGGSSTGGSSPLSSSAGSGSSGGRRRSASRGSGINSSSAGAQPLSGGQQARATDIYRYLTGKYGLTHNEAVAILGNMQTESNFDTGAVNHAEGAIGLIQWEGGRDDALRSFAGNRVGDWRAQVDFMMHELTTSESGAFAKFRSAAAESPAAGAAAFDQYYERSAGTTRQQRIANAQRFATTIAPAGRNDADAGQVAV
ncbi:hypothetical protein NN3_41630 [Nocardia neocaledoniensis NBRC 108232]|uniref:Phage tail lysozyme domain-containing protein n=1 Tax=Nocardia neocaledoniensis TaxID=236511 RepID=A0A317NH61_9NOCA|nr:phage tail tip lysozyme [Nocardia neocaledoniensis]PWV74515.1 hypothetical protein DFR69_106326 [Nocardia neocaledoniensis]GEM33156.1 hypothetical protein NN3_41630 [Nocardia neocaledoniensis NBRC 108232]